jgi:hypothetical protein
MKESNYVHAHTLLYAEKVPTTVFLSKVMVLAKYSSTKFSVFQ